MDVEKIIKLASTLIIEIIKTDLPNEEINRLNEIVGEIRDEALTITDVVGQSEQLKTADCLNALDGWELCKKQCERCKMTRGF